MTDLKGLSDERLREMVAFVEKAEAGGSFMHSIRTEDTLALASELLSHRAAEQQEPVAWQWQMIEGEANLWFVTNDADIAEKQRREGHKLVPLFASPQPPVPPGSGVRVKPLEWEKESTLMDGWIGRAGRMTRAVKRGWISATPFEFGSAAFATLEEAQAAAQADYETCILSALSSQAQTTGGVE